jgi:transcriptional regulator with XRE-family HTH domain
MTPDELKIHITHLGMTQAEFADALGVRRSAVSTWVNGHSPIPQTTAIIVNLMLRYDLGLPDLELAGGA